MGKVYENSFGGTDNPDRIKTRRFKGRPEQVYFEYSKWLNEISKDNPKFELIDKTVIPTPLGALMIVTYQDHKAYW